ncbi:TPA_exp: Uncharacterized protein A8136_0483 [Trichophyton benhamiae CBS 112371]|uniref:Non-homologous end-joining factor 1 n=1 Tax=Arthroderma benhamiae (strain ATCC MYA-4681 / CBS 112371) TaxID=663331 RepID=D4AJP2_ARTBC|nr:uncharacterized protein ARB_04492 [Trichophyton benhamiae CBS 112371]EFE36965.1 conserved hypothetical protein [Trichophyton benhamiae CBS 112371]DAA79710.1 TPA_exp: Uncharacterized protein A8136_0483 [Trichophyton benhamiae CBS 112371]
MTRNWVRLPLYSDSYPPLLFSYEPSSEGYDVFLTDLGHVWSESLSHKQIIDRAAKDDTSIDPSQDEDQYSVLLQKINDALHGSEGTSLFLSGRGAGSSLRLSTTTKLPKPLEPLEWTLVLSKCSPSALTRHMLVPTLRSWLGIEAQQQSLCELLEEKDKIIGKLFDKIESSGLDLSTVFPGMANIRHGQKRGSLFSQASKLVKGVSPFDKGSWETIHSSGASKKSTSIPVWKYLYDDDLFDARNMELIESEWWNLPTTSRSSNHPGKQAPNNLERCTENDGSESDNEFQTQETPPGLKEIGTRSSPDTTGHHINSEISPTWHSKKYKSSSQKPGSLGNANANIKIQPRTDSEDSTTTSAPESPPRQKNKLKSIGTIGGKKPRPPPRQQELDPAASEADDVVDKPPKPNLEDQATPSPTESDTSGDNDDDIHNKGANRAKGQTLPQQSHRGSQETDSTTQVAQLERQGPPRTRGLGRIGGKTQKESSSQSLGGKDDALATSSWGKTDSPEAEEGGGDHSNSASKQQPPDLSHGHNEQSTATAKPHKRSGRLGIIGGSKASSKFANVKGRNTSYNTTILQDTKDSSHHEASRMVDTREGPAQELPSLPPKSSAIDQTKAENTPGKEESPEERADRKRQELRRQLEAANKGQNKPAKKKRRF